MLVYRVENEQGDGPFIHNGTSNGVFLKLWHLSHSLDYHYSPVLDSSIGCKFFKQNYHCAVKDLDDLFSWFGDDKCLPYLKDHGYHVKVFDVPEGDYLIGNKQIVFVKANAKIVEEIPF